MVTNHTYQQFASRHQRQRLIKLIEERGDTEPTQDLWDAIQAHHITTTANTLKNVLQWKTKGPEPQNTVVLVPIDYTVTDGAMVHQTIIDNMVHVELTCVRKKKFHLTYQLPTHLTSRYAINKVSKPIFDLLEDGTIRLRYAVFTAAEPTTDTNVLGVDLGRVKPFTAAALSLEGSFSQELTCSRELARLNTKLDRLTTHRNNVYAKKEHQAKLLSKNPGDAVLHAKHERLEVEYTRLRSRATQLKEHMGWLAARDIIHHAVQNKCGIINMEDLSWLGSTGGKWDYSSTQAKIEHVAHSEGLRVQKVDAHGTSWEYPEHYDTNPVPKAALNISTRELTSPVTGKKMDKGLRCCYRCSVSA